MKPTTILLLAAGAFTAASANAAITSFSAVNGTTGPNTPPALNNSYGTVDMALNLGNGSPTPIVYDGITFTNNSVTSPTTSVTWATVGGISVGGSTGAGAQWSVRTNIVSGSGGPGNSYSNTFGTEAWSNKSGGGVTQTINISGLSTSKSYLIQLMHGEDRSLGDGLTYAGTLVATDSLSNSANASFAYGDDPNDANDTVFGLVTLEVFGVTGVDIFYPLTTSDRDPSLAGIVIQSQAIPEPSAILLGGLGGLLGLMRRRRR